MFFDILEKAPKASAKTAVDLERRDSLIAGIKMGKFATRISDDNLNIKLQSKLLRT